MNTTKTHSEVAQSSASNLLLIIIIIVLFIVFFRLEHDIFFTTHNPGFSLRTEEVANISQGNPEKRAMFLLLSIFSIIILKNGRDYSLTIRDSLGWLILANLSWATVSFFWADDPGLVGRRIVALYILYLTAFSISMNVRLRQLPTVVLWITAPTLVIGFFSERALRTWWFGSENYRFAGTMHPEGQAINCAMLLLAATTMTQKGERLSRVMAWGVMLFAAIFLVLTKSRGPFVGAIIALAVYGLCTKKRSKFVAYLYIFLLIFGLMAIVFGDALFPLLGSGVNLGRQESLGGLSGRTELWKECGEYVNERPMFGYGFGGFWKEDRALAVTISQQWPIRDSHSIYLDTLLDLGFIGLLILLALLIVAWWKALRICVIGGDEGGAFAASLLMLWTADGLWSSLVLVRGFVTLLLFIVLFGVARENQLRRARAGGGGER